MPILKGLKIQNLQTWFDLLRERERESERVEEEEEEEIEKELSGGEERVQILVQ